LLPLIAGCASETAAEHAATVYAQQEMDAAPPLGNLPDYSLPADKLLKAQHLAKVRIRLHFLGLFWNIAQLVLLLWLGVVAWMRNKATAFSAPMQARGKWIRAFLREVLIFSLLFTAVGFVLDLPLSVYAHQLSLSYGLSIQGWGSWFADQGKDLGLGVAESLMGFTLLMALIRWLPRGWWFVCWCVAMPLMLFMVFLSPLIIDPLFNKFEPLQKTQPELVTRLEQVANRGHIDIPVDRMYLMKASEKTTTLNAYVTGFGSSKRLVFWDTIIARMTPDELLLVFGHESGHYVLGHIVRGITLIFFGLLFALYIGYRFVNWTIARFGGRWQIPAQRDWGALAVLILCFTLLTSLIEPLQQALTRQQEHAADVFGQEAIHGIVADPQATAKGAFDVLGENSLEIPNVNQLIEFWTYSHPAIGRRAAFGKAYQPWAAGMEPKYFKK
jgi:Zn-dependent protease with chaperone function